MFPYARFSDQSQITTPYKLLVLIPSLTFFLDSLFILRLKDKSQRALQEELHCFGAHGYEFEQREGVGYIKADNIVNCVMKYRYSLT